METKLPKIRIGLRESKAFRDNSEVGGGDAVAKVIKSLKIKPGSVCVAFVSSGLRIKGVYVLPCTIEMGTKNPDQFWRLIKQSLKPLYEYGLTIYSSRAYVVYYMKDPDSQRKPFTDSVNYEVWTSLRETTKIINKLFSNFQTFNNITTQKKATKLLKDQLLTNQLKKSDNCLRVINDARINISIYGIIDDKGGMLGYESTSSVNKNTWNHIRSIK